MSGDTNPPLPRFPGYRVLRALGAGGMADVYLAEDLKHRRPVAIKVIKPEIVQAIGGDRFLREIEVTARLNHPHILPLFDSGAVDDRLYYVMPFVEGESLRARLDREGPLPVEEAVRIAREVASALGYAHQRGIVHRDVKPENILLSQGVALVADFGIARPPRGGEDQRTEAGTIAGALMGTPGYMSPEQIVGEEIDGRADLYALSCILFEMLTGSPPLAAPTRGALVRRHLADRPPLACELRESIPQALAGAVARGLEKAPADRFPSAARFAEALAASMSGTAAVTPLLQTGEVRPPHNLPKQRTHFIGRERELAECTRLLADTQLLTITGTGGCGKTRLALKLAEQLLAGFLDGVWFVDLAPITDGSRVPEAVCAALRVPESAGRSPMAVLGEHVHSRTLLIVFDNCEHLLAPVGAVIDELLRLSENVRVLATSREGFGLEGERLFALRSLSVPSAGARDSRAVGEAEAVRLFVDRAQLVDHGFSVTDVNAVTVAEICRRLDGIPLAIELAAARVRVLPVEQIRAKLDDRFRLLSGSGKASLPRHQTLRATIQWSYDLLSDTERRLLRRLSVFAGGWTLEHAARVAGEAEDEFEILELLGRLIEKSLVLLEREGAAGPRYRLLETVRQFARELLIEAGESESATARHASAFIELAERAYAERLPRDAYWGSVLEAEHDNMRAALDALRDDHPEGFLQLAGALAWFWNARSHILEGRERLEAALSTAQREPPRLERARALSGLAQMLALQGQAPASLPLMEEASRIWRTIGNLHDAALALEGMGWVQFLGGEDEAAYATFEACLHTAREVGDPVLINRAKVALAQALVALARIDEARPMAEEIVAFSRSVHDRRGEHFGWHFLADCALIEERYAESLRLYGESLRHAQVTADRLEIAFEVQGVAMSLSGLGRTEDAVRLAGAAFAEWERIGVDLQVRFWKALIERHIGSARHALGAQDAGVWNEGRAIPFERAVEMALTAGATSSS